MAGGELVLKGGDSERGDPQSRCLNRSFRAFDRDRVS